MAQLDLGAVQPITTAIDQWRLGIHRSQPPKDQPDPGTRLRRLLWQPLEAHLQGAKTVLISPDGALARLPLDALPGSKPDTYLIEETALALVPVPQLLPELLAPRKEADQSRPSLLLVGDVDYDAEPGRAETASPSAPRGTRTGTLFAFGHLDGTREEIAGLQHAFKQRFPGQAGMVLSKDQATKAVFKQQASKFRWLHLATHGFFAPPELRSALAPVENSKTNPGGIADLGHGLFERQGVSGFHPGLLSGLVLAGANHPPADGQDDGILTALEVAEMDLGGVEQAVLSACETGLGQLAGGEGLLGLQRAFQVAGARSVVASLWQVPDEATQVLMERFYTNLWQKKMSRLEALTEAQRWLLSQGLKHPGLVRGMVRRDRKEETSSDGRMPPFYWAAFVLSGDWR
jgi:CHAT domain-containing protein